jgi:hypothetical protein
MAEPGASRSALPSGPAWLVLPLVCLTCLVVYLKTKPARIGSTPTPGIADPESTVAGFATELRGDDGSRISLRLTPLHADARRQAFEARALRARLGFDEGEPWRLSLRWEASEGHGSRDDPRASGLLLERLELHDSEGRVLAPIHRPTDSLDPLLTLLAAPAEPLLPGNGTDLVLWGRSPRAASGELRLEGWPLQDPDAALRATGTTGFEGRPVLVSSDLRRAEIEGPLARLDRPSPSAAADAPAELPRSTATVGAGSDQF